MAHPEQKVFFSQLKQLYPQYFERVKVCEMGSLNINGSVRESFSDCSYTGFDVGAWPGVDEVVRGQLVGLSTGYFDATVSAECFEHNPFWVETFANMLRMTRPGGLVAFSCVSTGRAGLITSIFCTARGCLICTSMVSARAVRKKYVSNRRRC